MGNAELIEMRQDIPDPIREDTVRILESAQRCASIVRRIQTFGRPIDLTSTDAVDLHQVVKDTVDITQPKWKIGPEREGRTIYIALDLDEIPSINSQGVAWEEILSNLIFNAVVAMPQGGTITISTHQEGSEAVVAVADTATGMDEETRLRAFEPFFTTKDPERGTGLGMSTVWGLIKSLGGQVEIDSKPGMGTTFTLRVPVSTAPSSSPDSAGELREVSGLKILVIDDEPSVLELLVSFLPDHKVDTAGSGSEGLESLRQQTYDVVISDWVMAVVSGLEIAERVKRQSPDTVVILMTGWEFKGTIAEHNTNIDLIFSKPFEAEDIRQLINQAAQLQEQRQSGKELDMDTSPI